MNHCNVVVGVDVASVIFAGILTSQDEVFIRRNDGIIMHENDGIPDHERIIDDGICV